ncbi:hypothetical protein BDN70DRAFT_879249 [Pholiota conissans]|uniref:F-box domain-containing protein n=1 Tax=Pholiota conissans TaxID=109636 RepID=A0A9P5Z3W8_9AGAR|nr:hypothetical protein BDN70DRAFT_879249 [Pholiota conissans]
MSPLTPGPVQLPHDILVIIVSIVARDDPNCVSIKKCSLVCHDLLHLCRKYIYRSVVPPRFPSRSTALMIQKRLSAAPEIGAYIQNLDLDVKVHDLANDWLIESFKKITGLKQLALQLPWLDGGVHPWSYILVQPALLYLIQLPTLTHLTLSHIDNFYLPDLAPCVNLKHLTLKSLRYHPDIEYPIRPLPSKPMRLSNLAIVSMHRPEIDDLCAWHCAGGKPFVDFDSLKRLSYGMDDRWDLSAVRRLLAFCGSLIGIRLTFDVGGLGTYEGRLAEMLLPKLVTLKHLSLSIALDHSRPLCAFFRELDRMTNNIIETLEIRVCLDPSPYQADKFGEDCASLDTLLTKPVWQQLRKVSLSFVRRGDAGEALDLPGMHFPKLSSSPFISLKVNASG